MFISSETIPIGRFGGDASPRVGIIQPVEDHPWRPHVLRHRTYLFYG